MFKQAFRVAFVAIIWKQYKAAIISTLILFAYLYLIGSIHADYLAHVSLQNEAINTGMSFIVKWLALALGVITYAVFHFFRTKKSSQNNKTTNNNKLQAPEVYDDDPFKEIRARKKLRGPADFLIEEKEE